MAFYMALKEIGSDEAELRASGAYKSNLLGILRKQSVSSYARRGRTGTRKQERRTV